MRGIFDILVGVANISSGLCAPFALVFAVLAWWNARPRDRSNDFTNESGRHPNTRSPNTGPGNRLSDSSSVNGRNPPVGDIPLDDLNGNPGNDSVTDPRGGGSVPCARQRESANNPVTNPRGGRSVAEEQRHDNLANNSVGNPLGGGLVAGCSSPEDDEGADTGSKASDRTTSERRVGSGDNISPRVHGDSAVRLERDSSFCFESEPECVAGDSREKGESSSPPVIPPFEFEEFWPGRHNSSQFFHP